MTLSEKIKVLCVRCNISQSELARRIGTSPQNLNQKIKKGRLTLEEFEKIAQATETDSRYFFVLPSGETIE